MKIAECMSNDVQTVTPDQSLREAAALMLRIDAGSIPVLDDRRLVGMLTDRDIAVRAVAEGLGPDTPVSQAMTDHVDTCYDDEDISEVARRMSEVQVRRFPVVSRSEGQLVGIVSLGDFARSDHDDATRIAHEGVTEAGRSHNQSRES